MSKCQHRLKPKSVKKYSKNESKMEKINYSDIRNR